jgi:adhesin HecA-like repeat protein
MIGTTGAAVLLVLNIIFAGILGICAGGLTCVVLRRSWSFKAALIDAVTAAGVAIIVAYAVSAIDNARGVLESRTGLVLSAGVVSIVLRHLLAIRRTKP